MSHRVLVVDDELSIRNSLRDLLQDEGFGVEQAETGEECLAYFKSGAAAPVNAVLLDIWLPNIDGLEVLKSLKESHPSLPVIMISGHGSIDTAVTATKLGAYHFIEKPFAADALLLTLRHALRETHLEQENVELRRKAGRTHQKIIGSSDRIREMMDQTMRVAATEAWVLINGENGTGKELVAHLIHNGGVRRERPFVEVNCAAIPEELIESELFGHEKGSFTGATQRKIGKFDQANQGTLFLDEIGDMSLKTQAKILRVLQEQRFERVGGIKTIEVDVRVIAASNKKLEEEIAAGNFREDLYYRLNVLPIEVPPLRERTGDVSELVSYFLEFFADSYGQRPKKINPKALALLERYEWPGNVRELKNIVERMMIMVPGNVIEIANIPPAIAQAVEGGGKHGDSASPADVRGFGKTYREAKEAFDRSYLRSQLEHNGWNISRTAEVIGLERSNLHKKIKQLKIESGS